MRRKVGELQPRGEWTATGRVVTFRGIVCSEPREIGGKCPGRGFGEGGRLMVGLVRGETLAYAYLRKIQLKAGG